MKVCTLFNWDQVEQEFQQEEKELREAETQSPSKTKLSLRMYKCQRGCYKRFTSFSSRCYHHRAVHFRLQYACHWILCTKTFRSKQQLYRHMKTSHLDCMQEIARFLS